MANNLEIKINTYDLILIQISKQRRRDNFFLQENSNNKYRRNYKNRKSLSHNNCYRQGSSLMLKLVGKSMIGSRIFA